MAVVKKTDTSFEASFRSLGKATKDYTEQVGDSVEKLKKKVDRYSDAVAKGEKVDTVARLKAEKSYRAALAVRRESEQNDLKKLNMFHRLLAFGERKYDRIQKLKWFKTDLKDKRQLVDTKFGKALLKIGNSWEKFQNVKLFRVAADSYRRLKDHAISIFEEILGPAKQVFDIAMTAGRAVFSTLSGFIPILKKVGGIFGQKKDTDEVIQATNDARDKLVEQTKGINEKLEKQIAGQEHAAEQDVKMRKLAPKEAGKKGFFSSLLDGFAGFFGNIGTGLLGIFSTILGGGALLGIFKAALGIGAAAAAGYGLGTVIQKKWGGEIGSFVEGVAQIISPSRKKLMEAGAVSAKFESGKGGYATVSGGENDPGGISYGKYQMSSKKGVVHDFLKSSGFGKNFSGLKVGSPEYKKQWETMAKDPAFQKAQEDYILEKNVKPVMAMAEMMGFNLQGKAMQNALFSQGVQTGLGGNKKILENAKAALMKKGGMGSEQEQIDAMYGARAQYYKATADWHEREGRLGEARTLRNIAAGGGRLEKEQAMVQGISRTEAVSPADAGGAPTVASLERLEAVAKTSAEARIQEDFFRAIREGRSSTGSGPQVVNLLQQGGGNIQNALSSDAEIPITFYPANFMLASSGNQ